MEYKNTPYYRVGRATDLAGTDRLIYRLLEILPGFLSWLTIFGTIIISYFLPFWAAIFIIVFDLYWLLKTVYLSIHLRQNWKKMKHNMNLDWEKMLVNLKYDHIYQMILLPFYNESEIVIRHSLDSLVSSKYDKKKFIVILAIEERAGQKAVDMAEKMRQIYATQFGYFLVTRHPSGVPGEMGGKGSNIAYSAEEARRKILNKNQIQLIQVSL